ncbi:hypothetical protein [Streptomyces griseorubiginosus]|uniref:hypothetical protein n=1 Tax=Streptomyces griseorubiginosus TaxID=67304 RepID=UPI0036E5A29B
MTQHPESQPDQTDLDDARDRLHGRCVRVRAGGVVGEAEDLGEKEHDRRHHARGEGEDRQGDGRGVLAVFDAQVVEPEHHGQVGDGEYDARSDGRKIHSALSG